MAIAMETHHFLCRYGAYTCGGSASLWLLDPPDTVKSQQFSGGSASLWLLDPPDTAKFQQFSGPLFFCCRA